MAGLIIRAQDPSESERQSAQLVAALLPPTWTVILQSPSGGRGGTGGSTADLAIFTGGSTANAPNGDDYQDEPQTQPIDVFTPESGTGPQSVAETVRGKLSGQAAGGVCVDLSKVPEAKRDGIVAILQNTKILTVPRGAVVLVHAKGEQLAVIGQLPGHR